VSTSTAAAPPASRGAEAPVPDVPVDATGAAAGVSAPWARGAAEGVFPAASEAEGVGDLVAGAFFVGFALGFAPLLGVTAAPPFSSAGNTTSEHE
jgi:hypothetical protein